MRNVVPKILVSSTAPRPAWPATTHVTGPAAPYVAELKHGTGSLTLVRCCSASTRDGRYGSGPWSPAAGVAIMARGTWPISGRHSRGSHTGWPAYRV